MIVYDPTMLKERLRGAPFLDVPFIELATQDGGSRIMANTVATGAVLGMLGMRHRRLPRGHRRDSWQERAQKTVEENRKAAAGAATYAVEHCKRCGFEMAPGRQSPHVHRRELGSRPRRGPVRVHVLCRLPHDALDGHPPLHGGEVRGIRHRGGAGRGRDSRGQHGHRRVLRRRPVDDGHRRRRLRPHGRRRLPGRHDGDAPRHRRRAAAGPGDGPAHEDRAGGPALRRSTRATGNSRGSVFAPGSPEQALYLTNKAFDLAEKYQIPAFVLTDQYLADSPWTYEGFDLDKDRLQGLPPDETPAPPEDGGPATRGTPSPLPASLPSPCPGASERLVVEDSDEHDEEGHLIEDAETAKDGAEEAAPASSRRSGRRSPRPSLYGSRRPETVLVGWGSTYGVLREAVDILSARKEIAFLHFSEV